MKLFDLMQIEALLSYWTWIVWTCVCLLLFTGKYELVRPVLWLYEDEDFCAYLNPAYLHYNASETTTAGVQETHHCPVNAMLRVWIRGLVRKLCACSWMRCCQNDSHFCLMRWNWWYDSQWHVFPCLLLRMQTFCQITGSSNTRLHSCAVIKAPWPLILACELRKIKDPPKPGSSPKFPHLFFGPPSICLENVVKICS